MLTQPAEILLAEDNPSDLKLTLHAFSQHQIAHTLNVVRDGEEVLEFIFCKGSYATRSNSNPHLILLDLKLPRLDGIEVLRMLKSDPKTRSIPVVMLTSSREDKDLAECYNLGVNSYIVKPVDFDQFGEVVRQLGLYWLLINQPPPG